MSQDVPNTIFCILHVLCADLCMPHVQIYVCVMCIAVQTGSLRFAGLASPAIIYIRALKGMEPKRALKGMGPKRAL